MKSMHKFCALALSSMLILGLLAGCGNDTVTIDTGLGAPVYDTGAIIDPFTVDPDLSDEPDLSGELDLDGRTGSIGGDEATNDALADLIDSQEKEREDAGKNEADGQDENIPDDSQDIQIEPPEIGIVKPADPPENTGDSAVSDDIITPVVDPVVMPAESSEDIQDEMVALSGSVYQTYLPTASTTDIKASNNYGWIDYGNAADGYIVVCYTASTSQRLKCIVKGPSGTQYTYNLTQGAVTTLPLSDGNGNYTISLYENVTGTKYAKNLSQDIQVSLKDEFGPFLYSNQYVDYMSAPNTRATGADLCSRATDLLGKVDQVYSWVVSNISYDHNKASTVQSGYLPVLDTVLANRTGICFDYAALMSGMLRSQGIPCKLVVGYAGTAYHAWISVWSDETGWIEGVIYFDGTSWQRMDPTFASSGGQSAEIMQYIGDGSHYTAKYLY